jgi:hypothetical protein
MKILVFILFLSLLVSCDLNQASALDLGPPEDAIAWVAKNIKYKSDGADYWQPPYETLALRTGDCEDFSMLLAAALETYNVDVHLVGVRRPDGTFHLFIRAMGKYIEPQTGKVFTPTDPIIFDKTYMWGFWYATIGQFSTSTEVQ